MQSCIIYAFGLIYFSLIKDDNGDDLDLHNDSNQNTSTKDEEDDEKNNDDVETEEER